MRLNLKREPNASVWVWRVLFGPAQIMDGVVSTISAGTLFLGAALAVSRQMAMSRTAAKRAAAKGE